jgi:hypothetical protein
MNEDSQSPVRISMAAVRCRGAGCRRREASGQAPRPVAGGARLCEGCTTRLAVEVTRLPALYEACGQVLTGADGPRERTSGGPLPGMPFNAAASEARSAILGVLGSWAALISDERRVTPPLRAPAPLARFVQLHANWLAAHQAAASVSEEIAQLVRRARQITDPDIRRRVTIGPCVEHGCPGTLVAAVRPQQPQVPAEIVCDADPGHCWFGHQWLQLSRRLRAAHPGAGDAADTVHWLSGADIARLWGIAPGSVYRHASEQRWRRRSDAGRTRYHAGDVQRTLRRRTGRAEAEAR